MPRIGSISGRSLANTATRRTFASYPFNAANISASATALQLGNSARWQGSPTPIIANTSTWTFSGGNVTFTGTGLPYHSYGSERAANVPAPQNYIKTWTYRGGTTVEGNNVATGGGLIGLWLNGVAIYNPSAQGGAPFGPNLLAPTWQYNAASEAGRELGYTFGEDLAGGHASPPDQYHYHDGAFLNAWLTGVGYDSGPVGSTGVAEASVIKYLMSGLTHANGHSKILGISADGYPVYGPYGYVRASDATSGVKRMVTGYTLNSADSRVGTAVNNTTAYPLGIFIEDYSFTASGDLDQHNGRFCITPDYPSGTYAYFLTLNSSLLPVYPYVIGNTYFGPPANLV
jgi:hypothetical protein